MKVEVQELKPKKAVIKIEDTKPYCVNALRRVMLAELPKLAIENIIIYDNTTALFDEIIAHRLGMIPIPTDLSLLNFREECVCKGQGCPNCTVRYTLSKEGEGVVYSSDLQPEEKTWAIQEEGIPIVELFNDQRLILEVEAILGRGKDHAKWQPVQAPGYRFQSLLEINKDRLDEVKEFVEELPEGIVELKNNELLLKDMDKLPVLESFIDKAKADYITIKRDDNTIIYSFETDGALSAQDVLRESAKILSEKYAEFDRLLKKIT
jgi:DNA-directed RNA polymerase subunit D